MTDNMKMLKEAAGLITELLTNDIPDVSDVLTREGKNLEFIEISYVVSVPNDLPFRVILELEPDDSDGFRIYRYISRSVTRINRVEYGVYLWYIGTAFTGMLQESINRMHETVIKSIKEIDTCLSGMGDLTLNLLKSYYR